MVEQKEIEEFLIRFGGAMTGGLEDAAMEGYHKATPAVWGKFPFIRPHPNLPPYDDIIVGGLAIPPWVIGALMEEDAKKKGDTKAKELGKKVKMFGEGDAIYTFNMLVHHTVWATEKTEIHARVPARVPARSAPSSGSRRTDVGHRIIKL